jgi:hypothetical protein
VVDISHPNYEDQIGVVNKTLQELKALKSPSLPYSTKWICTSNILLMNGWTIQPRTRSWKTWKPDGKDRLTITRSSFLHWKEIILMD